MTNLGFHIKLANIFNKFKGKINITLTIKININFTGDETGRHQISNFSFSHKKEALNYIKSQIIPNCFTKDQEEEIKQELLEVFSPHIL